MRIFFPLLFVLISCTGCRVSFSIGDPSCRQLVQTRPVRYDAQANQKIYNKTQEEGGYYFDSRTGKAYALPRKSEQTHVCFGKKLCNICQPENNR